MTAIQPLFDRFIELLQVPLVPFDRTVVFRDTSHEELCKAFLYWFSQLQLLFGEPVQMTITQGLHDEGVDVIIEFMKSQIKFGLQIKSYSDLENEDFIRKVMSQISYSKKHSLSRLFIVVCADITRSVQKERTRILLSNLSQMDEYTVPVTPEKAVVVLECFRGKEHPLAFIKGFKEIASMLQGLGRALSDDAYTATVSATWKLRKEPPVSEYPVRGRISFKPGLSAIKGLDLIRQATKAGQPVTVPGEMIESLSFLDEQGRPLIPPGGKAEYLKIIPDAAKLPPINLVTKDLETSSTVRLDNIRLVRERVEGNALYLVSHDHPQPFQLSLVLDIRGGPGSFSFRVDPELADVKQGLEIARFVRGLFKSGYLEFRYQSNDSLIGICRSKPGPEPFSQEWIELLEALSFVQDRTGVRILLPTSATLSDLDLAKKTQALLNSGKIELDEYPFEFHFTKTNAATALKELRDKGFLSGFLLKSNDFRVKLFSHELSLGPARVEVPCARPIEDPSSLEKRYQSLGDSERMPVQFVTCDKPPPILYLDKAPVRAGPA